MPEHRPDKPTQPSSRRRGPRSLRFQLLFALNGAVVLVLAGFAAWDYANEWRVHLREKQTALSEEALTLLPAVFRQRGDPAAVQSYIDDVCGRMKERRSPGHHIAVEIGRREWQARAHGRQSPQMLRAMRAGAAHPRGLADTERGPIVVGHASSGDLSLFVSEYVSNIRRILRRQIARRLLSIVSLGLVLAAVVTFLTDRMVTRPLHAIVGAVRRLRRGDLGAQVPTFRSRELGFLADEFNEMSAALAEADRERRWELDKARRIQEHLAPSSRTYEGLSAEYVHRPATEVAGDYFDAAARGDEAVVFCVADVTGHGVPAAMGAATLKTLFLSAVRQTDDPARVLAIIHEGFAAVSLAEDYATVIVTVMEPKAGRMRYASAGHEPAYLFRASGPTESLEPTGPLLGVPDFGGWTARSVEVRPGDRVVLVTDGLAEASSETGELFGRERLRATLEANRARPLDELASRVMAAVAAHRGNAPQADDVTLVLVEFRGAGED